MANPSSIARLRAASEIALAAGELARRFLTDPKALGIALKGPRDFVTAADRAVEVLIAERIAAAFPEDRLYAEESAATTGLAPADWLWVVDPIDGTANFLRGRAEWCVSIAVLRAGHPEIGVICHPASGDLFVAQRGEGATCNGRPIAVGACATLAEATIGLDHVHETASAEYLEQVRAILSAGGDYRRTGSAALSLAHVADGRLDGFVEMHLQAWDVLAGILLVKEAGGWTSDFLRGDGMFTGNPMIATTRRLRDALLAATGLDAWRD